MGVIWVQVLTLIEAAIEMESWILELKGLSGPTPGVPQGAQR